ncbi:MAG: metal-sulfur cluster assembly factor [Anaerolineae bacterium]|nr:metal-sulfur cluster assembly factor [Anaerolineae bacterium]
MSESPHTPENKEEQVREALRAVVDPEIGMNVIELGLIRRLDIQPDSAHVVMILTTPFCPYAPQLLEQVRYTVQKVLGVRTTIEMGREMWDPSFMEDGAIANWGLF